MIAHIFAINLLDRQRGWRQILTMVSFNRYQDYGLDRTLAEARVRYFDDNGFGADGGYGDAWVDFMFGPVPFPFPNTPARVRAVRYHDLHHVLTGYATDFWGEMDISAWEIGAGCRDYAAAWQLNLGGLACGALCKPRRTLRAFARGRRSHSLYGMPFEPLLERTVGDVRSELGLGPGDPEPRVLDAILLALWAVVGLVVGLFTFAVFLPLVPVAWLLFWWKRRRDAAAPGRLTLTSKSG
jgi:hypothetical protein